MKIMSLRHGEIEYLQDEKLVRKPLSRKQEISGLIQKPNWNRSAQLFVVLLCAAMLKLYYSTASPNQLRWILAPTTVLVELVSDRSFEFESYAGYISSDHTFLIAASCAGVNFLITSFLMLTLRKLWGDRTQNIAWRFIPMAAIFAYLTTLVANTVRIYIALQLQRTRVETTWLNQDQLHRVEGIFVYFGFLLLLFVISERMNYENRSTLWRLSLFPLLIYYATALGIPLANGAYRQGTDFWEHSAFVLLTPLLPILVLAMFRFYRVGLIVQRQYCPRRGRQRLS
jgi:exosortase K